MKKLFTILAVALCSTLVMAQTNQYFWAGGQFIIGNPIGQIDSVTFGELDNTDSIMLYLPHTIKVVHDTIIQKEYIYDTVYIHDCDTDANWNGFIAKAMEDNTVIHYGYEVVTGLTYSDPTKTYDCTTIEGSLYYSYDAETWNEWVCMDSIVLHKGQRIYLKGSKPYFGILDNLLFYLNVTKGTAQGYGYINSFFENGDIYSKTTFGTCSMNYFFRGNWEVKLSFSEGITEIGSRFIFGYPFAHNNKIVEIKLPNTLQTLGCTSFEGAQMTELTIPHSVEYIGDAAFHKCNKLAIVNYLGTVSEWNNITKGNYIWSKTNRPITNVVHCIDGDASF